MVEPMVVVVVVEEEMVVVVVMLILQPRLAGGESQIIRHCNPDHTLP